MYSERLMQNLGMAGEILCHLLIGIRLKIKKLMFNVIK